MTTLDELTTPLTRAEVESAIYAALAARGVRTTLWKPGSVVRAIITGVSLVVSSLSQLQADVARGGFLELAEGDWLTLVARYVFGVERNPGSFATGTVTLTNTGGGLYSGDAGDLVVSTADGRLFRNTASYSLGAAPDSISVAVQAVELGTGNNAAAGEVDTLVTTLLGVTVTNAAALVGIDEETDDALRVRCREKTGTLSPNGPRDAYAFVARSTVRRTDGTPIGVTRVLTVADGFGGVDVYVADADGSITGTNTDPTTDLGAIAEAIHTQVEPLAVTPDVQSATPLGIAVTYTLWVRDSSGLSNAQIQTLVQGRLDAFMASQPIGGEIIPGEPGRVYKDAIEAVIGAAMEPWLIDVEVSLPVGDVTLAVPQAPVLGTVTPTIVQVTRGLT